MLDINGFNLVLTFEVKLYNEMGLEFTYCKKYSDEKGEKKC